MRIGVVSHPGMGGSAVVASELAGALSRRGDDVFVYAPERPFRLPPGPVFRPLAVPDHPVFPAPSLGLSVAEGLARAIERDRLDLLHVHYAVPLAASAALARQLVSPHAAPALVVTLHGTDVTGAPGHELARTTAWGLARADALTAPSAALAAQVASDRPVTVVPNFVALPPGPPAPLEGSTLVHVSNLREVKRPVDLVRVLARVTHPDARLEVVGEGPEEGAVREAATASGIAERVTLLGALPDVGPSLRRASVFLLPSESESFGLALLEAMAAGLPVVATRTGGVPEVVRDGVDGWLHDVGDVDGMARSVDRLLASAPLRRRMGAAARQRASEFDESRVVAAYRAVYREARGLVRAGG